MDKILYVLFLTGICIWQLPALHSLYMTFRSRVYIRRNLKKVTSENLFLKRSPLGQHLALVIEGAETEKFFTSLENFYLISLILGAGSGLAAYLATGPFMALLCGIFMGLLPYTILMARLYGRRVSITWLEERRNTDKRMLERLNIESCRLNIRIEHVFVGFTNEQPLRPFWKTRVCEIEPNKAGL